MAAMSTWAIVFPIVSSFQGEALTEIYALLAAVMFVSGETVCFPSRSFHSRTISPIRFGKSRCFGEALKRVKHSKNVFARDCEGEAEPGPDAGGTFQQGSVQMVPT